MVILLLAAIVLTSGAHAQASESAMATPSPMADVAPERRMQPSTDSVPDAAVEIEHYAAKPLPATGGCLIRGIGRSFAYDPRGTNVRAAFEESTRALAERFGPYVDEDELAPDAYWHGEAHWVLSIRQGERRFARTWRNDVGSRLPSPLDEVRLSVRALRSDASHVIVEYVLRNVGACSPDMARDAEAGF